MSRLLGSASAYATANYNRGTVRTLPPDLQTGPLRAAVAYATPDRGPQTEFIRGEVKALVDNLPQGIGEGLKARVVNF